MRGSIQSGWKQIRKKKCFFKKSAGHYIFFALSVHNTISPFLEDVLCLHSQEAQVSLEESGLPTTPWVPLSVIFHTLDISAMALPMMGFSENVGATFMFPF